MTKNRAATVGHSAIRANDDGTVTFPLSSEEPYRRFGGNEILVHSASAVDLSWLNSGNAPLLDNHNRFDGISKQIGVITAAWIKSKRLYVSVRFSARPEAQAVKQDVLDNIVRNVSVGYEIHSETPADEDENYFVTKWKPTEASFVPVPADMTVGVGRSAKPMEAHMPDDKNAPEGDQRARMPGQKTEAERAAELETALNEIRELASSHNIGQVGEAFIEAQIRSGGVPSIELFRGVARSKIPEGTALKNHDIGLGDQEKRRFSLVKLARSMRDGATRSEIEDAAFEREACEAAEKSMGQGKGQFRLPTDLMETWGDFERNGVHSSVLTRAPVGVTVGSSNTPGTVVTDDMLTGRFIDSLRNRLVLGQLGITVLPGLEGNIEIPGADQNSQAFWIGSEDEGAAETVPTFRKMEMSIHTVGAYTDITRTMLIQSDIAIEAYVRSQLLSGMAEAIDLAGWYGTGTGGQPTGLANTTGIGSITFGASTPTRDELIDMDTLIADTNRQGEAQFATTIADAAALRKTKLDAGSGRFLMEGGSLEIGNPLTRTNQITSGDFFAGIFADMMMGMWGSLDLDRSTEAKFLSGGIRLRALQSVDFGVSRVGSFVLGNDGA